MKDYGESDFRVSFPHTTDSLVKKDSRKEVVNFTIYRSWFPPFSWGPLQEIVDLEIGRDFIWPKMYD